MRRLLALSTALALSAAACDRRDPPPPATTAPTAVASAAPPASTAEAQPPPSAPAASSAAPVPAPIPRVRVENIGMHIGGGPNDAVTKAPIADSVAPHFDELRACWARVDDPTRGGDFGVDLLIPGSGGIATVSLPRIAIHGDAFRDCVLGVFARVDFRKPRTGKTTVSYSLRFTPES